MAEFDVPTVRVKPWHKSQGAFVTINKDDFEKPRHDGSKHEPFDEAARAELEPSDRNLRIARVGGRFVLKKGVKVISPFFDTEGKAQEAFEFEKLKIAERASGANS